MEQWITSGPSRVLPARKTLIFPVYRCRLPVDFTGAVSDHAPYQPLVELFASLGVDRSNPGVRKGSSKVTHAVSMRFDREENIVALGYSY